MGRFGGHVVATCHTVEIPLDDELFSTLHRRNRRQLQNIREASSATLDLSRVRKVLQVTGSKDAISSVQRQLQSLNGPRKQVPTAVWAELMRTRTVPLEEGCAIPTPNASIAGLQMVSECRVHMERSRCEVRLFGPDDCASKASRLIDALESECVEERVFLGATEPPLLGTMQCLGELHEAVVLSQDNCIVVLGIREAVREATAHVQRCILGQEPWPAPVVQEDQVDLIKLPSAVQQMAQQRNDPSRRILRDRKMHMASPMMMPMVQPQEGSMQNDPCGSCCPTCGAGRFCVECGEPVWTTNSGSWVWVPEGEAYQQSPNLYQQSLNSYLQMPMGEPESNQMVMVPMLMPTGQWQLACQAE